LSFDLKFAVSNSAEGDEFLRAIKIRSTPSFGGEIKWSILRSKFLLRVKEAFEV
jgi:hypothetical protein